MATMKLTEFDRLMPASDCTLRNSWSPSWWPSQSSLSVSMLLTRASTLWAVSLPTILMSLSSALNPIVLLDLEVLLRRVLDFIEIMPTWLKSFLIDSEFLNRKNSVFRWCSYASMNWFSWSFWIKFKKASWISVSCSCRMSPASLIYSLQRSGLLWWSMIALQTIGIASSSITSDRSPSIPCSWPCFSKLRNTSRAFRMFFWLLAIDSDSTLKALPKFATSLFA